MHAGGTPRSDASRLRPSWQLIVLCAVVASGVFIGVVAVDAAPTLTNNDCWECHDGHYHVATGTEYINCNTSGCHVGEAPLAFADVDSDHGDLLSPDNNYDCTFCHNSSYPAVPQHTAAALDSAHLTTTPFVDCASCHSANLMTEHADDCGLCHDSTDPDVITAITTGDVGCDACHEASVVSASHLSLHDGGTSDPTCLGCHESNTSDEHDGDCGLCHDSTDPDVVAAISAGDITCGACHDIADGHVSLHDPGSQNDSCAKYPGCHVASLIDEHESDCMLCHDSTDALVVEAIAAGSLTCRSCHPVYHLQAASPDRYLPWDDALAIMADNGVMDPGTPHGGYTASTTKCAVCHAVHRASSDRTSPGVGSHWYLTAGSNACTACHTVWGSQPSAVVIEYGDPTGTQGPHAHAVEGCMGACHAGIHGFAASEYAVAARFLLSPNLDASMTVALAAGNVNDGAEGNSNVDAATLNTAFGSLSANDQKGTRAMVTGYLCAQSGCHTSSQFAVNAWGYADLHASDPADSSKLDRFFTGHITAYDEHGCGNGCHQVAGDAADSACATCHDVVGVATNSTAFPHGNRGIDIYEFTRPAPTYELTATNKPDIEAGNLWMYAGDATHRDAAGEPTDSPRWDGHPKGGGTVLGYDSARTNTRTLIEGAVGFHDGHIGNINDGTCLKCHGYGSAGDGYWPHHGDNPDQDFSSK